MAVTYVYSAVAGDITFDFTNQVISCAATLDDLEIQELVNACREAEYSEAGLAFPKICNASGKDYLDVDSGVQVGITIVLLDSWLVYTEKTVGVFRVLGGNLVQVSGGNPFKDNTAVTYVNILSAAGTVVQVSSGSGLSTAEHNRLFALPTTTLEADERAKVMALPEQSEYDNLILQSQELYDIAGLNAAKPMTVTKTRRQAGTIDLALTGDGQTSTTVTRQ